MPNDAYVKDYMNFAARNHVVVPTAAQRKATPAEYMDACINTTSAQQGSLTDAYRVFGQPVSKG
jgi:hypothetical protein